MEEYKIWLDKLKNLINKKDFETQNSFEISPSLRLMIDNVEKDNIKYKIDQYGNYMRVYFPNGKNVVFYKRNYSINDQMLIKIYNDKVLTGKILEENNIPTPKTFFLQHQRSLYYRETINDIFGAKKFAQQVGFPIIAKPKGASLGRGVEKLFSQNHLDEFLNRFSEQERSSTYLLQPYVKGKDIRVVFFDGKIQLAYERIAMSVFGDGKTKLKDLIQDYISTNDNPKAKLDKDSIEKYVQDEGYDLNIIPNNGEKISLVATSNVSSGGDVKNYKRDEKEEEFVKKVVDIFAAPLTGLDILTTGKLYEGVVLELNHTPMFDGASKVEKDFDKKMVSKFWDYLKRQNNF